MKQKLFPYLGIGLGLRSRHYSDVLEGHSKVDWFEALSENFMDDGGRPLHVLKKVRAERPIHLHGVSLSIASTDPLDRDYLQKLRHLADVIEPALISDHCCWTGQSGENLHDLMPIPFTKEAIEHLRERILAVQDFLGRRILLENVSSYLNFAHSEMSEWEFLAELSERSDCGLLLDINNVYVSSQNHHFDPLVYLNGLPMERVGQIHLAGHTERKNADGSVILIDTHDQPVCDEVWELYRHVVCRTGGISTMVEWDAEIPDYARLEEEVMKAQAIRDELGSQRVQR